MYFSVLILVTWVLIRTFRPQLVFRVKKRYFLQKFSWRWDEI